MAIKRFSPSLMGIPEEENNNFALVPLYDQTRPSVSRRDSIISLKRENSRRKVCSGCPGCEPHDFNKLCGQLADHSFAACETCCTTANSKQRSIRKWLEDVPILRQSHDSSGDEDKVHRVPKRLRSPARSLPPNSISTPTRALSPRPASERGTSPESDLSFKLQQYKNQKKINKPKSPPPPIPDCSENKNEVEYETIGEKPNVIFNLPPPDMIQEAMAFDSKSDEIRIPTLTKKHMNAVINELSEQRKIVTGYTTNSEPSKKRLEYETDSLERSGCCKGYSTPTEYADLSSSQPSPSLSAALPMEEEMTMQNAIFNKNTGHMTLSKINVEGLPDTDHDYELVVVKKGTLTKQDGFYKLPEFLQRKHGYSLVSEVYVNNGYNYNSAPSSITESNSSTLDSRGCKVRYDESVEKPGKLLIEVEDCPDNYIPVDESDSFEPDTLDRRINRQNKSGTPVNIINDSLERPQQILLRTSGSFKDIEKNSLPNENSNFSRIFGSLREIYEAKAKGLTARSQNDLPIKGTNEGKILTLEERHSKRQRRLTIAGGIVVQPDVIPPPPHDNSPIYERPKPPRRILSEHNILLKPPLPPKNGIDRGTSNKTSSRNEQQPITFNNDIVFKVGTPVNFHQTLKSLFFDQRPEDSGYISTDSGDSQILKTITARSESDESLMDGESESGAESIETHSVFFGSFRKPSYFTFESVDSGVEIDSVGGIVPELSATLPPRKRYINNKTGIISNG